MSQPWPESENLTGRELVRDQQDCDELMCLLFDSAHLLMSGPDDGDSGPDGGVREPRRPDDPPPPLVEHAPEPDRG
jgi:hypothetical protein